MMTINEYEFGRIRIDDREYRHDVILTPDRVHAGWRRREGHSLHMEDLTEVLRDAPQVLVIGTGYYGRMQVLQETLAALSARGIDTRVHQTRAAVAEFNRVQHSAARVVAALHLTC